MDYRHIADRASAARAVIATASTSIKNSALMAIRDSIITNQAKILTANLLDLDAGRNNGLDEALLDRLQLDDERIDAMIRGVEQIVALPDPVGEISQVTQQTFWHRSWSYATTPRYHWDYLRISTKCDNRCRCLMSEVRERERTKRR